MVRNPVSPGGDDVVKVRLQGTKEDMEWLEEQLEQMRLQQEVIRRLQKVCIITNLHLRIKLEM
jgi:hypothetical protein